MTDAQIFGRTWVTVLRTTEPEPCINCGDDTTTRIAFNAPTPLAICARCRGC